MMSTIGNFLFHYRNGIFPLVYFLLFVREPVTTNYSTSLLIGGLTIAVFGQLVRAITIGLKYIKRGGKDRRVYADSLVVDGIFQHCRNPLYTGNLLILLGVGLATNSKWFLLVGIPFFLFAYRAIVAAEENYLDKKFPLDYANYCNQTNQFWPSLKGLSTTIRSIPFNWRRLISAEYGSTFIWAAAILTANLAGANATLPSYHQPLNREILGSLLLLTFAAYTTARVLKKTGQLKSN